MLNFPILCDLFPFSTFNCANEGRMYKNLIIPAAASEPEANERGSSLISRRLHCRGLQSLFVTKHKGLWLCASGRFRQWYAARNCGYARMGRFRMRSISKSRLTKGHEI